MCGRFALTTVDPQLLSQLFGLNITQIPTLKPRYNIAPGQMAQVVVVAPNAERKMMPMLFGLMPSWRQARDQRPPLINARAETVQQKPSFRQSFAKRRCLVPANGLYEWTDTGRGKRPYYVFGKNLELLAFAGIWDRWEREDEVIESFAILTTEANALLASLHHRMPVMVKQQQFDAWLAPETHRATDLLPLLKPYPDDLLDMHPVSSLVNHPQSDVPECIAPIKPEDPATSDFGGTQAFHFD